jgi:NAD(P)H dehydrogenase (quinone)
MAILHTIYHSGFGHTKLQAQAVHRGASSVSGVQTHLWTSEEAMARINDLDQTDAMIFGCPTYMGSMSAEMKKFVEATASKWFTQAWKDKIAGAFTNSSNFSGDKMNTLFGLMVNAMQHGMIYVSLGMLPTANKPEYLQRIEGPGPDAWNRSSSSLGAMASSFGLEPGKAPSTGDLETAEAYGRRIAEITVRWVRGKSG